MQLCNVTVRLAGSLHNTVHKRDVSPAEILILRHIHGNDAVVDIRPTRIDKERLQSDERDRLAKFYDKRAGGFASEAGADNEKSIIAKLFPGAVAKLPTTLAEIGLGELEPPAPAAPAPRTRKPRAEKAEAPVAEPETDEAAEDDTPEPAEEAAEAATVTPGGMSFATPPEGEDEGDGEAAATAEGQ